jgi:diguanylate cyclase (GGDEF)-like protein/PAS domain S-box-containing protein
MGEDGCAAHALGLQYLQLLEHSPVPLCVHAGGRVVYVNPAGVEGIAARSAGDIVGRMITDFVHPDHIGPMLARIAGLRRQGDASPPAEAVMLRLDGSPIDAEIVSVLTTWDGKPAYQVIFRDLTLLKAVQATLHLQGTLVSHATEAIIATTLTGTVTSWNPAAETIYQRPPARALALPISEAVGAPIDPAVIAVRGGVENCTHRAADGSARTVRVAVAAMDNGYVLVCSDYTALRRAEERFQNVVNALEDGVVVLDAQCRAEWINPAARRLLGLAYNQTLIDGIDLSTVFPLSDASGTPLGPIAPLIQHVLANSLVIRNRIIGIDRLDGTRCWLSASVRPLDDGESGQPAALACFSDITEQYTEQVLLNHKAHHDSLTGLPNRAYAEARASHALQGHPPALAAVMFIDLDNVKDINDELGHHGGDIAITTAARRLRSALGADDFLARHGGDEFVALLFGHAHRDALQRLSDRMHAALARPLDIGGTLRTLSASIGVAQVSPADHRDAAHILRDADNAMYRAKAHRATTHFADTKPGAPQHQRVTAPPDLEAPHAVHST